MFSDFLCWSWISKALAHTSIALAHTLIALAHALIALTHLKSVEKLHRLQFGLGKIIRCTWDTGICFNVKLCNVLYLCIGACEKYAKSDRPTQRIKGKIYLNLTLILLLHFGWGFFSYVCFIL